MTRKPGGVVDDAFLKCLDGGLNDALWASELREERDELVYGMLYLKHVVEKVLTDRFGVTIGRYDTKSERVDVNLNLMHRYLESVEDFYVDKPDRVAGCGCVMK